MPRIKDLTTKSGNLSNADFFATDNGTVVTKIDYTALAKAIIEQYNGSTLAGSAQSVQAALNSLNSNLIAPTSTVRILPSSDFNNYKTGGVFYVASDSDAATMTNIPRNASGKLIVLIRGANSNYVTQYYITTSGIYLCYIRNYNNGTWTDWELQPRRVEMDTVTTNLNGVKIFTSSITANASKTFTVESNSRILAVVLTNQTAAIGAFGISVTSGGSVYRQKIGGGESIEISAVATNAVTFTHSATSGGGIVAFICFSGSVSET